MDVVRILGPITQRTEDENTQTIRGEQIVRGKPVSFVVEQAEGLKVTYSPKSNLDRYALSCLRGICNKVAYCVGCETCIVECPTGAFQIDENAKISISTEKCVHCYKCVSELYKGCKLAGCLCTTMGGSKMKFIGMNRYTTLGFRESFLEHFFDLQNDCWSSKELGNLQYASLKVWLKEAEIIEINPNTDKNGQITELGERLIALGVYHPMVWAVIWTNLAYNSSLIKWYLLCVEKGETYEKGDFVFLIG